MNPLPPEWQRALAQSSVVPLVLVDGAMQHEVGQKLSRRCEDALSLFDDLAADAQALGPWLMSQERAHAVGIDGAGRGVNWIASTLPLHEAHAHLRPWIRGTDPTVRDYLRVADGRVLRALQKVWTPKQWQAFCLPWRGWCCADRDGRAVALAMPARMGHAKRVPVSLEPSQNDALLEMGVPDELLHELKAMVTPHPQLSTRESRYRCVRVAYRFALALGYDHHEDYLTLAAWALRQGDETVAALPTLPAVKARWRGDMLWTALMHPSEGQQARPRDMPQPIQGAT